MFARILFGLAGVVAVVCLPSKAPAATIVNWGGNYVPSPGRNFQGVESSGSAYLEGGTSPDGYRWRAFSETTDMQPQEYTGPRFYGGYQAIRIDATTLPVFQYRRVSYSATGDYFHFDFSMTSGNWVARAMVFFQKPDFLSLTDNTIVFGEGDRLSMYVRGQIEGLARFVVRDGNTYYAANQTYTGAGLKLLDPAATSWKAWNPNDKLDFNEASAGFAPHEFRDITAVGFYWEMSRSGGTAKIEVGSFSATATALPPAQPEPEPQPEPDPGQTNPVPTPQALAAGVFGLAWVVGRRLWR
jgi:hypothetical protein